MKIVKYQMDDEQAVLTFLITSTPALSRIHSKLNGEQKPFTSPQANIIAGWCLKHFTDYQVAPDKGIGELFRQWSERHNNESMVDQIEIILTALSKSYAQSKELSVEQMISLATKHFNAVKLDKLQQAVEQDLLKKDPAAAAEKVAAHVPINLKASKFTSHFCDRQSVKAAYHKREVEVLVHYPKDLGIFFGPHLRRDSFVCFMAPEKRGKTWFLMDLAWRAAVRDRRRVLLYSIGDMSHDGIQKRLLSRTTRRPIWPGRYPIPKSLALSSEEGRGGHGCANAFSAEYDYRVFEQLTNREIDDKYKHMDNDPGDRLRFLCEPNYTKTVADIEADVTALIREDWPPDVIVTDYADLFAPEPGSQRQEFRHQSNIIWMALKRLAQKHHCLVVSATQASAKSYGQDLIRSWHFSEDKRKLSQTDGIVGINQTEAEKEQGIYRLNWLVLREGNYFETRVVGCAGCLDIAAPCIVSALGTGWPESKPAAAEEPAEPGSQR